MSVLRGFGNELLGPLCLSGQETAPGGGVSGMEASYCFLKFLPGTGYSPDSHLDRGLTCWSLV